MAREDLSLAKLAEAHWDACAILEEAGRTPVPDDVYAVWASRSPECAIRLERGFLTGQKPFCSGAGLVDRALITLDEPCDLLAEIDLAAHRDSVSIELSSWVSPAFADTQTGTIAFDDFEIDPSCIVGAEGWYLQRPGFWHGACSPAACWAGGATGLLDYGVASSRSDPHTLAHLGAIAAEVAGMEAVLAWAAAEMDAAPQDVGAAHRRALSVRHLIESACTRILTGFGRAFGPHPLAMDLGISRRFAEIELYIRQCHAERDLQQLGGAMRGYLE
ncbi:MAG TPA: hypothetical protein VGF88_06770 [Acidobacteriaceae bacterium]